MIKAVVFDADDYRIRALAELPDLVAAHES